MNKGDQFTTKDSRSFTVEHIESGSERPVCVVFDNDDVYWITLDAKMDVSDKEAIK